MKKVKNKVVMSKKIIFSIFLFVVFAFASFNDVQAITTAPIETENMSVSVEADDIEKDEFDIIKKISLKNKLRRSPKAQIESFYKKYNRYTDKNDMKKLKELYSDSFVNNDGFDKDTIFKLMEEASSAYKNVNYTTEILSIDVSGNYAVVKIKETAVGETSEKSSKLNDVGYITSEMFFKNYLRKEDGKWKIISAEIESELIALKYGEAKKTNIQFYAPSVIPAGTEYEATVRLEAPDGVLIVGSIVNEPIKFPQVNARDVLRAVKSEELARILKSNNDNYNEYATVSIGITRAHIEPPSVVVNMTGMAIVMSRVNVINKKNVIKIEKETNDVKTSK